MSDLSLQELDAGVILVTFNRPAQLNAFRRETYEELLALVQRVPDESAWRALVLTGAGRAFCSGQDLTDVPSGPVDTATLSHALEVIQSITRGLVAAPIPTIAAINGPAVGFGLELTLSCDLRFAADSAYFMLPELRHGLFHTNGTYHWLPLLTSPSIAADMILTGRRLTAEEGRGVGLVSRVLPANDLLTTTLEVATTVARLPREALGLARRGLRDGQLRASLEGSLAFEASACVELLTRSAPVLPVRDTSQRPA